MERATGRKIRGVVEDALGHSSGSETRASREQVEELWDPEADSAGGAGTVSTDASRQMDDTLERAQAILDTAPVEDREEISELTGELRRAISEGRTENAEDIRQNLEEILFYLE